MVIFCVLVYVLVVFLNLLVIFFLKIYMLGLILKVNI